VIAAYFIVNALPITMLFFQILFWIISIFLAYTCIQDLLFHIPNTLGRDYQVTSDQAAIKNHQKTYKLKDTVFSLITIAIRVLTIILAGYWFLFA
jgi:hypothetical protein